MRSTARAFPYPPTPDVAEAVLRRLARDRAPARRRLGRAAAVATVVLAVAAALLAVPQVRAAVLEALNVGAIRILPRNPAPTPTAPVTASPTVLLPPLSDLAGETTLSEARVEAGFPLRLPAHPPDLGAPDRVFLQEWGGPVVILVWLDPEQPGRVRLSLHQLGPGTFGEKVEPTVVQETTVGGRPAVWTQGPYLLQMRSGASQVQRLIEGHVLIWTEGEITYRLETDLSLEEAVRIAESVR